MLDRAYAARLHEKMGVADFIRRRIIRLYPLYACGLALGLFFRAVKMLAHQPGAMPLPDFLISAPFNLLMLPSPVDRMLFPFNGPSWSLFVEMVLNIAFAALLVRLSSTVLALVSLAGGLVILLMVGGGHPVDMGWEWPSMAGGLARGFFAFPLGMLMHRWLGSRPRGTSWLALLTPLAVVIFLTVVIPAGQRTAFELIGLFVLIPLFMVTGALWELPHWTNRPALFLGDISYAVYAVHAPLLGVSVMIGNRLHLPPALHILAFMGGIIILSALLTRFVDKPVRRWLNGR